MNHENIGIYENSFDIIKLICSFMVLFGHLFKHLDIKVPNWFLFISDGSLGVMAFFVITGFTIMPAWERSQAKQNGCLSFYWNRIKRIYPCLIISLIFITLINSFVIENNVFTIDYVKYSIKYLLFFLGGGYEKNSISNGSIWTLKINLIYYFLTPFIWKTTKNLHIREWILIIIVFWLFNVYDTEILSLINKLQISRNSSYKIGTVAYFLYENFINTESFFLFYLYELFIGSFLYFKRNEILIRVKKIRPHFFVAFLIVYYYLVKNAILFPAKGIVHSPWLGLVVPFLVVFTAFSLGEHRFEIDLSYGIYLFHMIVLNTLKYKNLNIYHTFAIVVIITPIISYVENKYIEKLPRLIGGSTL